MFFPVGFETQHLLVRRRPKEWGKYCPVGNRDFSSSVKRHPQHPFEFIAQVRLFEFSESTCQRRDADVGCFKGLQILSQRKSLELYADLRKILHRI